MSRLMTKEMWIGFVVWAVIVNGIAGLVIESPFLAMALITGVGFLLFCFSDGSIFRSEGGE